LIPKKQKTNTSRRAYIYAHIICERDMHRLRAPTSALARAICGAAVAACVALLASCAAADGVAPGAVARVSLPTGAAAGDHELSPFYRWAEPLPAPGALLRSELVATQTDMAAAGQSLRILYTSTDTRWRSGAIAVSGMLFLPSGETPAGGWPLLSWAHGTLGVSDRCAPSWTGLRERDATYLNRWLAAGFAVVATGLGGPGPHPYLDWRSEGASVLDAARAALAAAPDRIANQVFVAGQSQGSGAALGAAMLAQEYAPTLNVRGAIATGFNRTFAEGPVSVPPRNSPNLFLSYTTGGLRDDAPAIDDILTADGRVILQAAREGCTSEIGREARRLNIGGLAQVFSISTDELGAIALPVTEMPMQRIAIPLFFGTGLADETTTPTLQYGGVAAMCAVGNAVTWRRYDRLGHDGALHGSFNDSLAFARALLAESGVTADCDQLAPPGMIQERDPSAPFNDD
jgi:hypothetical protein